MKFSNHIKQDETYYKVPDKNRYTGYCIIQDGEYTPINEGTKLKYYNYSVIANIEKNIEIEFEVKYNYDNQTWEIISKDKTDKLQSLMNDYINGFCGIQIIIATRKD